MIKKLTIPLLIIGVGFTFYYFAKKKRLFIAQETEKSLSEIYNKLNKNNLQINEDDTKSKLSELTLEELTELNSNIESLNGSRQNFQVVLSDPNSLQSYNDTLGLAKRILKKIDMENILKNY